MNFTGEQSLSPDPDNHEYELDLLPGLEQLGQIHPQSELEPLSDYEPVEVEKDTHVSQELPGEDKGLLQATLNYLVQITEQLRSDFENKITYDAGKERQIDNLHSELQAYRAGLHFKIIRPLIIDLISMHDDLTGLIEDISAQQEAIPTTQVANNLESFRETIEQILERHGVNPYMAEGENFVSGKQRTLKAIETSEISQDKQIAKRISKGFEYEDKVLRPELVITYRAGAH